MTIAKFAALALLASTPAGAQQRGVTIGAVLPLSGAEGRAGAMIRDGYLLAIELKMREGGLSLAGDRLPVQLVIRDDKSDPAQSAKEAESLAGSVDLMLGGFGVAQTGPESAVALRAKIPYVAVEGSPSPEMLHNPYFFSVLAPLEELAKTTMRWLDEERKAGQLPAEIRLALLWEDSDHGRDYRRAVRDIAENGAFRMVLDRSFPIGARDHKAQIEMVRAAKADVLLVDAHYEDFVALHREYTAAGLCHEVLSYGVGGAEPSAFKDLPAHSLDYLVSTVWWNRQMQGPSQKFVREFEARFHREPDWPEALGFEAARALMAAVEKAGSKDRERVRRALGELRMESILPGGYLRFPDEFGRQAHYRDIIMQNQPDGTSPIVSPLISAQAKAVVPNPRCRK